MTAATAEQQKAQRKKTRLGRILLPQIDGDSALLPPDKWILKTAYEFVKDNKSFHDTAGHTLAYAGGGFLAAAAGIACGVLAVTTAPLLALAGIAALGLAFFAGKKAQHHFQRLKSETLPEVRTDIGKKYLTYKMDELKAAWKKNVDEKRKQKEAQATAPQPAPEKKPDTPKPETKAQQPVQEQSAAGEKKKSLGSLFGDFAKRMAEERLKQLKQDDAAKTADKKPEDKKTDERTPEPPKTPAPPQP